MIDLASDINLNHFIAPERSRPQSVVPIGQGPARAGIAEAGDTHIQLDRILPAMPRQVEHPANVRLGQSITWHWLANLCDRGQKLPQRALARRRTRPWPRRPGVAESKDMVQLNARGHHSFRSFAAESQRIIVRIDAVGHCHRTVARVQFVSAIGDVLANLAAHPV